MKYRIKTRTKKLLADTLTPVNIYLKVRDIYANSILLESSDYHGHENSLSIICCDPIASFEIKDEIICTRVPGRSMEANPVTTGNQVFESFDRFLHSFEIVGENGSYPNGLFGYTAYDAARYFDDVKIDLKERLIPDMVYQVYRYVIVVDHFFNELTLLENSTDADMVEQQSVRLERLEQIIYSNRFSTFPFSAGLQEESNLSDDDYLQMVRKGIHHCHRGDVFQIVLSRRFNRSFMGDEFNVYRALRSINPSPYLFYFDYGNFKIFGSSPEAQIEVKNGEARIYPIAGTIRRSGNDTEDAILADKLSSDEKENSEHLMLVDLARNDLSRDSTHVKVDVFREIQYYSHVIHLVSKVSGQLDPGTSSVRLACNTFPAGTLSGAPKHKAMELINEYENINRSFYGGAIGFIGFNGSINQAIMIRTFLSRNNQLISQAGAGIVAKSVPEKELEEVNSKLEALRKAIKLAETI